MNTLLNALPTTHVLVEGWSFSGVVEMFRRSLPRYNIRYLNTTLGMETANPTQQLYQLHHMVLNLQLKNLNELGMYKK